MRKLRNEENYTVLRWDEERVGILTKWLKALDRRYRKEKLESWQIYLNRMMAKALRRDIAALRREMTEARMTIRQGRQQQPLCRTLRSVDGYTYPRY